MKALACTLISGSYHIGAAALANSLHASGYEGPFYVFHRGPRPTWTADGTWTAPDRLELGPMSVRFMADDEAQFIALRKPACLQSVFELEPACEAVAFIDADIVMRARWDRIEHWLSCGIAVCGDGWMQQTPSEHHPLRVQWRRTLAEMARQARPVTPYFNSGFVGARRGDADFIALWRRIGDRIAATSAQPIAGTHAGDRTDPFFIPDQDAMNVALMGVETPISALGPEGMGFSTFGTHMTHFATHPKPWLANYVLRALRGLPAAAAERQFWDNLRGPIRPLGKASLAWRAIDFAIARIVSRFYARPYA